MRQRASKVAASTVCADRLKALSGGSNSSGAASSSAGANSVRALSVWLASKGVTASSVASTKNPLIM